MSLILVVLNRKYVIICYTKYAIYTIHANNDIL